MTERLYWPGRVPFKKQSSVPPAAEVCVHHWLIGPPTYSHDGLIEDTDWECKLCGEKKHNTLLCPFNEVQDEWVEGLF